MSPLALYVFVGVLALFRFENATGAGAASASDDYEGSNGPPPEERGEGTARSPSLASDEEFVEEQFRFLDLETGDEDASTTPSSPPADASVSTTPSSPPADASVSTTGDEDASTTPSSPPADASVSIAQKFSIFPQCWPVETTTEAHPTDGSQVCRVDVSLAVPPSRHPLRSHESAQGRASVFNILLPSWAAVMSRARSTREHGSLWNVEIVHRLLWNTFQSARTVSSQFRVTPEHIRSSLFALLRLAEAILYAEGVYGASGDIWYYEVEAALQLSRNEFDNILRLLEQVFHPDVPAIEPTQTTAGPAEATRGAPAGKGGVERTRAASVLVRRRSSTSMRLQEMLARLRRASATGITEVSPRTRTLLSEDDLLSLRLYSIRLSDMLSSRPKYQRSSGRTEYGDYVRMFQVNMARTSDNVIPHKSGNKHRQRLLDALNEVIAVTLAVTSESASRPPSLTDYLYVLTKLSKSIRVLISEKEFAPKPWKGQVTEILGHAYIRLELLLTQREVFMENLPYS